ncbi:hypothetical protein KC887_05910 [Candidatus Kaiserbacteria bacterium]|nr:hypothetical protein [Candidatus Kaiserbacteria bacterium]
MIKTVAVHDKMQDGYQYELTAPTGGGFHPDFKPHLTPKEMLALGVFEGVYMCDCTDEFPGDWFVNAKFAPDKPDKSLNYFGVHASQPLSKWKRKGWIYKDDPRGWFQWYCRYYMGRRLSDGEDERQIKRWRAFARHAAQVAHNCRPGDEFCRPRQRQALLHWAYDSRRL